jgi:hypothetical protein
MFIIYFFNMSTKKEKKCRDKIIIFLSNQKFENDILSDRTV